MKKTAVVLLLTALSLPLIGTPVRSQLIFRKAFQEKHGIEKLTSCYTCHARGNAGGNLLGREHRNVFGAEIAKALAGKNVTKRLQDAKELPPEQKDAVTAKVLEEFNKALTGAEAKKSPEGPTWGELIEKLDGKESSLADYLKEKELDGPVKSTK